VNDLASTTPSFEPNDRNINSITARPNEDGSITVYLGGCGDDRSNWVGARLVGRRSGEPAGLGARQ
jgi:hypothetical protein